MTSSSIFLISLKIILTTITDRFWKALPPNNLTLLAYNEVSYIFPFHFVKRKVFVLAARRDGNPLNIQPQGLAADAWQKLLILIWKWWGSYWESRLSILLSTCCYSLPPLLFDSWFSLPRYVATFFNPFLFTHVHLIVQEWLRTKLTKAARSN